MPGWRRRAEAGLVTLRGRSVARRVNAVDQDCVSECAGRRPLKIGGWVGMVRMGGWTPLRWAFGDSDAKIEVGAPGECEDQGSRRGGGQRGPKGDSERSAVGLNGENARVQGRGQRSQRLRAD